MWAICGRRTPRPKHISHINMPDLSGVDTTTIIRKLENQSKENYFVLILGLTGNIDSESLEIYKKCGMNGCILKGKNLEESVEEAIRLHENHNEFIDLTK